MDGLMLVTGDVVPSESEIVRSEEVERMAIWMRSDEEHHDDGEHLSAGVAGPFASGSIGYELRPDRDPRLVWDWRGETELVDRPDLAGASRESLRAATIAFGVERARAIVEAAREHLAWIEGVKP